MNAGLAASPARENLSRHRGSRIVKPPAVFADYRLLKQRRIYTPWRSVCARVDDFSI